jgi:acetoin utilization deacetylase AcuC-like enzyme/ribosomal protein S18 acetylase RimI-like enzyme
MFRIRRVPDDTSPANAATIVEVQAILRAQFSSLDESDVASLPQKLRDPLKYRFRPLLLVAEDSRAHVRGFAMLLHAPDLRFCYLDYVAVAPGRGGGGIGGALYDRVREESAALDVVALFFECLPDDPALCRDEATLAENVERLKFYERYGARPVAGTAYETPVEPGGDNPPYLCLDALGRSELPGRDVMRAIVRAILERKYAGLCPPEYVNMVVDSFCDDPVVLRAPRYRRRVKRAVSTQRVLEERVALVVNDKHDIHHVRERGYVEAPVRVASILRDLEPTGDFTRVEARRFPDRHILAVHDGRLIDYLRRACELAGDGPSVYPYVFPIRNATRPPRELPLRAGYWCIDTFTPINRNAWLAARRAADCALTAAERVLEGQRLAYALVRPPGHHAERNAFGGFCYINNSAVAAHFLSRYGQVAVLDIDYHHGNGTQEIFYDRSDVLTISIHGHPSFAYPYFSGFAGETGRGRGSGFNMNLPLPEAQTPDQYREALGEVLRRVERFAPDYLVLAAGFDTASGDPTGTWSNRRDDFHRMGESIGALGLPTVVVQEGGYRVRTLGTNVRAFFAGLVTAAAKSPRTDGPRRSRRAQIPGYEFRDVPREADAEAVRALVVATGVFSTEEATIAKELVEERLTRGEAAGYSFVFAECDGVLAGYACYGPIAGAQFRYDLYWIAVHPRWQHDGLARALHERVELAIAAVGGVRIYADTASGDPYEAARRFYRARGYRKAAELPDFYSNGDAKIIFAKPIGATAPAA